ncbi:MAG TPA: YCF48-related protein [Ignavibacteria bacterium]|nr:YCF48-related protein [Ignavibacteria bacterium]HRB01663.1 YCF48-related protein [Ignavibacteria bacterium]
MKKLYSLIIMILLLNTAAFSQSEWYLQYINHNQNPRSVHFINAITGWAVGSDGTILKTTNSGKNWIVLNDLNISLSSIQFLDIYTGWVSGYDTTGCIFKTTNGGINWIRQSSNVTDYIFKIQFEDINNGWALSERNVIRTTNGGVNWVSKYNGLQYVDIVAGFFIDANTGWVGGSDNWGAAIRKTTNGGATWNYTANADTINVTIFDMNFIDVNTGWAVGIHGDVIKSTNGGNTWRKIYEDYNITPFSIQFINSKTGWIVGEGNNVSAIMKTVNGGENWSKLILDYPPFVIHMSRLNSVFFIDSVNGWASGDGGIISTVNTNDSDDVGVTVVNKPVLYSKHYVKCSDNESIIPEVTIKNFGSKDQDNFFDVHLVIENGNSIVYQNTKQDTISSGQMHTIEFEPYTLNFDLQTFNYEDYVVRAWTSLISDSNYNNDSAVSSFSVVNSNYGYSDLSGYYFLNSSADAGCIPDQPVFSWEDTTGSVNLIAGGIAQFPFSAGNIFNGCFRLPDVITDGNKFRFFGVCYDTIVISTNGIIGLGSSLTGMTSSSPVNIPSVSAPRPAVFPFWYKCNYFDPEILGRNLKYKISGNKFIVTYDRLPIYNAVFDSNDYVSCQVILETGTGCGTENGKITVQFDDSKSGSTFLNHYYNNSLNANTVGIQNSTGTIGIQYRRSENNTIVTTPGPLFGSPLAITFGQINEVLPVELESFTSVVYENNVTLHWSVLSEINNSGFEIERRQLNINQQSGWMKIGFEPGAGNSAHPNAYLFEDINLSAGIYDYRIKQIDFNGNFEYFELMNSVEIGIPKKFSLSQNYPNPFNPVTKIKFSLPQDSKVNLIIFDVLGKEVNRLVNNEFKPAGFYIIDFNGSGLSSGVYYYKIEAGDFKQVKRMVMVK